MTNLLSSWRVLTSWRIFEFMTNIWRDDVLFWRHGELFEVMTNLLSSCRVLTSWCKFSCQGELIDIMTYFWRHDVFCDVIMNILKWWRVHDIMTNFWCDKLFDVITYVALLTSWRSFYVMEFMMTWYTFWCHDALFDIMTNLLTSLCVLYFMTNFLLSWRIFDVMTSFLSSWHFVHHFRSKILWKRVFLCHWHNDIFLTLWQTFGVFLMSWQT